MRHPINLQWAHLAETLSHFKVRKSTHEQKHGGIRRLRLFLFTCWLTEQFDVVVDLFSRCLLLSYAGGHVTAGNHVMINL